MFLDSNYSFSYHIRVLESIVRDGNKKFIYNAKNRNFEGIDKNKKELFSWQIEDLIFIKTIISYLFKRDDVCLTSVNNLLNALDERILYVKNWFSVFYRNLFGLGEVLDNSKESIERYKGLKKILQEVSGGVFKRISDVIETSLSKENKTVETNTKTYFSLENAKSNFSYNNFYKIHTEEIALKISSNNLARVLLQKISDLEKENKSVYYVFQKQLLITELKEILSSLGNILPKKKKEKNFYEGILRDLGTLYFSCNSDFLLVVSLFFKCNIKKDDKWYFEKYETISKEGKTFVNKLIKYFFKQENLLIKTINDILGLLVEKILKIESSERELMDSYSDYLGTIESMLKELKVSNNDIFFLICESFLFSFFERNKDILTDILLPWKENSAFKDVFYQKIRRFFKG